MNVAEFILRRAGIILAAAATLLLVPAAAHAQAQATRAAEAEVRAVIERMFQGLRDRDTTVMRSTFHPDFRLAITTFRDGQPLIRQVGGDQFLASIANADAELDEQISDVEIRVEDNLAMVWNRYVFYVNGEADHCGVDAFILVRETDGWKVLQVADTQRREGCG